MNYIKNEYHAIIEKRRFIDNVLVIKEKYNGYADYLDVEVVIINKNTDIKTIDYLYEKGKKINMHKSNDEIFDDFVEFKNDYFNLLDKKRDLNMLKNKINNF